MVEEWVAKKGEGKVTKLEEGLVAELDRDGCPSRRGMGVQVGEGWVSK